MDNLDFFAPPPSGDDLVRKFYVDYRPTSAWREGAPLELCGPPLRGGRAGGGREARGLDPVPVGSAAERVDVADVLEVGADGGEGDLLVPADLVGDALDVGGGDVVDAGERLFGAIVRQKTRSARPVGPTLPTRTQDVWQPGWPSSLWSSR